MKTLALSLLLLAAFIPSYSQVGDAYLQKKDSVRLASVWGKFKQGLATKNSIAVRKLSLNRVVGADAFTSTSSNSSFNPYLSIDSFLSQFYAQILTKSKLWSVMGKDRYHMVAVKGYYPSDATHKRPRRFIIYQLWYGTWKPKESKDGWEGLQQAFQFVKINGDFKFFGLTSTP